MEAVAVVPEHPAVVKGAVGGADHCFGEQPREFQLPLDIRRRQRRVTHFVAVIGILGNPADINNSVGMIDRLHVGADNPPRGLLINHLAPRHAAGVIGLQCAHIGIELAGPLVPPIGKIHFRAPRFTFMAGNPRERTIVLKLDGLAIGKINDPFPIVSHGVNGKIAVGGIIDPGRTALRPSSGTIETKGSLPSGPPHSPVEISQAIGLKEASCVGVAAARHPTVKSAVIVGDQFLVIKIDRTPLFEANVVGYCDQVRLVLHGADRVLIEIKQQLFSREALSWRHGDFIAAISPHLHPVRTISLPARRDVKP